MRFLVPTVVFGAALAVLGPSAIGHAAPAPETFGPTGSGNLRVGMGIAEAVLTGDITDVAWFDNAKLDPFACHSFRTRFGTSGSFNHGEIVEISLPAAASTPEGITVGSTRDQVRAAYPDLYIGIDTSSVRVPGNPAFKYGIGGISAQQASGQTVNALTIFKAHTDICRQ